MRGLAAGGIVGPVAFAGAWAIGSAALDGYSPVHDAISRLAERGAPTAPLMTAGLVALGVGVPLYGLALRAAVPGPAWLAAVITGLATLGVAALPLGGSVDGPHGVAAGVGYASLTLTPLLGAATSLVPRAWSLGVAAVSAVCLAATVLGPASGLWQRVGLSVGHAWIAATAVRLLRARPT